MQPGHGWVRSQSSQIEKQPEHKYVSFTVSDYAQMLSQRCVYWEGVRSLEMIAVQLGQTSSTSSLAGQYMCLQTDDLRSPMSG